MVQCNLLNKPYTRFPSNMAISITLVAYVCVVYVCISLENNVT